MLTPNKRHRKTGRVSRTGASSSSQEVLEGGAVIAHATVYILVNIGLFVINLLTGGGW